MNAKQFEIENQQLTFVSFPNKHLNDTFSIEYSDGCKKIADLEGDLEKIHECSIFLVSQNQGKKNVHKITSKVKRGFELLFEGAVFSPMEDRVALLFTKSDTPFEDQGPKNFYFIGAKLKSGFSKSEK